MKPSTIARCAIANEYLRRRKHPFCDVTNRTRLEHHVELLSVTIAHVQEEPQTDAELQETSNCTPSPILSTANEKHDTVAIDVRTVDMDNTSLASRHHRKPSVRKPILMGGHTKSAVLTALQLNSDESAPVARENAEEAAFIEAGVLLERDIIVKASRDTTNHDHEIFPKFRFPTMEPTSALQGSSPSPHSEETSDTASPTSDTTLFEDAPPCPISQLGCDEDIGAYAACDDIFKEEVPTTWTSQREGYEATPVATHVLRHRRYRSSHSSFDAAEIPSMSLRSRSRTNDGLLLFRADSSKGPMEIAHESRHHRKVSLGLPVNPHAEQTDGAQRFQGPNVKNCAKPTADMGITYHTASIGALTSEERDLEYMHRHTFIGTGSLDDLLEVLEVLPSHNTTKAAVVRAFVRLASAEQLYARQYSTGSNGWDLVSRTTLSVMGVTSVDYIIQLQVKLGSITLRKFLDLIPFDQFNEVSALRVVEAFCVASHLNATAGTGAQSKARAFRRWLVDQKKMDSNV